MSSVTIQTTDTQHVFAATIVDSSNNPIPNETGDGYTWTADDAGQLFAPPLGQNGNLCTAKPTGKAGTVNLTCAASKSGAQTVTGVIQVIIQGPVRDHVNIAMQS